MARKATVTKISQANTSSECVGLRELKVVRSHNFYPTHYLDEVFSEDVKGIKASGDALLKLRHEAEKALSVLAEGKLSGEDRAELNKKLATATFSALGYYALDASAGDTLVHLEMERTGRATRSIPVGLEKRIALRDGSELWLCIDAQSVPERASGEQFLESTCSCAKAEHDDGVTTWRKVVDLTFNTDRVDVAWFFVNTGTGLFLFERNRWLEEGEAWLEADLLEMWDLNSLDHAKMVEVLFAPPAFPIVSPESWHNTIATSAHKKATEVSRSLRDTVRESVELLANEVLAHHAKSPLVSWKDVDFQKNVARDAAAQELFEQVLRVVYRMLFILVVEGQPQSKRALPIEAQVYQKGLSLEKLRDLEGIPLVGDAGSQSSFIWATLKRQTEIYFRGFNSEHRHVNEKDPRTDSLGFSFPHLGIHLFNPDGCPLVKNVDFSDRTMQQVVRKLSLAQTGSGKSKRTHRVYYGSISLNRLGEVYEGLLSLRPQILDEKMLVLKRDPKEHAPMLVTPAKAKSIDDELFAMDETGHKITRQAGEFVLTPTGFERKLSASYYTPEELTQFLATEAVDCLLKKDARAKDFAEVCTRIPQIENLKICEPAMGNGAFCNAVVNELAARLGKLYVQRAEFAAEEGSKIKILPSEAIGNLEVQRGRAKEHILRHGVYGVDLNPTAVELARVSLWLNALHKDCDLPYLDFKLRCGNSLVGAWVKKYRVAAGSVPHFLLPMPEMISSHLDGKFLGDRNRPFLSGAEKDRVQALRNEIGSVAKQREALSDPKLKVRLVALTERVDILFKEHHEKRVKLQDELAREFNLTPAAREAKANAFLKDDTAYNQLRAMMDLWCALWFWPHSELKAFPNPANFLSAMEFFAETPLAYGGAGLEKQLAASGLKFLTIARKVALRERFFHWDVEFPEVFERGGFDLVLGNPPWASVAWEESDFFDSLEHGVSTSDGDAGSRNVEYNKILNAHVSAADSYMNGWCKRDGYTAFLNSSSTYDFKDSSKTNTYKFFHQRFMQTTRNGGIHAILAQDGLLNDAGNTSVRSVMYCELERVFRFINEMPLFPEITNHVQFFAGVSRRGKKNVSFELLDNLYHPETVNRCRQESINAPYRGMKNEFDNWEVRGHPKRIVHLDEGRLMALGRLTGAANLSETVLPVIHGEVEASVLSLLAAHSLKLEFGEHLQSSQFFNETNAPREGLIRKAPCHGKGVSHSVLTGPNIFVGNPAYKQPNRGCSTNRDYSESNLHAITDDFFPHTLYETTDVGLKSDRYNKKTPWGSREVDEYRLFIREFVGTTSYRTIQSAICPPECAHVHAIVSLSFDQVEKLIEVSASTASLLFDFIGRCLSGGHINQTFLKCLPSFSKEQSESVLFAALSIRTLRLNCISSHYSPLWKKVWRPEFAETDLQSNFTPKYPYARLSNKWQRNSALRDPKEREQALCEIDAIVAILFGISKQDLLDLYRSQFAVLQKNLQDLPGQTPNPEKFHFPRYQAMSDAYDSCMALLNGKCKPKRTA